jgi:hypothetical protein
MKSLKEEDNISLEKLKIREDCYKYFTYLAFDMLYSMEEYLHRKPEMSDSEKIKIFDEKLEKFYPDYQKYFKDKGLDKI